MELLCYTYDGWKPRIRPASSRRNWMDQSPESFAYRCLPLKIANAHGWEVLSPCGFSAEWNGGAAPGDVSITVDPGTRDEDRPEALFGLGTLTVHVSGIIRTPPGWNLWVSGNPNSAKDGIAPLGGVIETDWSPFTFTMNWRFTRPGHTIRFEENEPFAFIFPVQRGSIEQFEPLVLPIEEAPELKAQFEEWSRSRDAFHRQMRDNPPSRPSEKWQKHYFRGLDASGCEHVSDHQTKIRAQAFAGIGPFADAVIAPEPTIPVLAAERGREVPKNSGETLSLAKRDWLLQSLRSLRSLSSREQDISRRASISREEFRDEYYALNRPVVLTQDIADWPAVKRWSPEYLRDKIGAATPVEYQGNRSEGSAYERYKDAHKVSGTFGDFLDLVTSSKDGNTAYITAYNSGENAAAFAPLAEDLGAIPAMLTDSGPGMNGMPWIGAGGTFTPLHHDLTNNLLVQITGTKHVLMVPPEEAPRLYNDKHVFSRIEDLEHVDLEQFPEAAQLRIYRTELRPGEALFIPLGWWHQVVSEDFSVSMTFTNFRWPNDFYSAYPGD